MIEDFEYEEFAQSLKEQADGLLPVDIPDEHKEYIKNTMYNFCVLSGKALVNDSSLGINMDEAVLICQIIAEWTFHKGIDLSRSGIESKHWDSILQKIAFTIFEVAKQSIQNKMEQQEMLETIEHHVKKIYKECIDEFAEKEDISLEIAEFAKGLSNFDKMEEEIRSNEGAGVNKEVNEGVNYETSDVNHERKQVSPKAQNKQQEIENTENKMFERLGIDEVSILIGEGLLSVVDPDKGGDLLNRYGILRKDMTDDLGYIIPPVRIMDSTKLEENEYAIFIRGNQAGSGFVYPEKYMVIADEWDEKIGKIPKDAIVGIDPTYTTQVYWVSKENVTAAKNLIAVDTEDVIITHLKNTLIRNVNEIITFADIVKYRMLVESSAFSSLYLDKMIDKISYFGIRKVFVNLIREEVSIKDITLIFERLGEFSIKTTDPDELSEMLRIALKRQISLANIDENRVMYAVTLSNKWEKRLEESLMQTEFGMRLNLNPDEIQELLELTSSSLSTAYEQYKQYPVVLCPHKIRLPLYRFLVQNIPNVVVLAYPETVSDIKVENCGIIGEVQEGEVQEKTKEVF